MKSGSAFVTVGIRRGNSGSMGCLTGGGPVQADFLSAFNLHDAILVDDDLHDSEPERAHLLAHQVEPVGVVVFGFKSGFHKAIWSRRGQSSRELQYVNRVCAFRSVFLNLAKYPLKYGTI